MKIVLSRSPSPRISLIKSLALGASVLACIGIAGCATNQPSGSGQVSSAQNLLQMTCSFKPSGASFSGTCNVPCSVNALAVNFDGIIKDRQCDAPERTVKTTLATTAVAGRWLGTMEGVKPEDPTRLEVVPNKSNGASVARMPYGWFNVVSLTQTTAGIELKVDASRQVRPNSDDLAIIDRAIALLPSAQTWNKNDNRQCPAGQTKLSMFCALTQATAEVAGGNHYRQPAMQAVREELNLVDAKRINTHRIMDYNNHPDTTLEEIHSLLRKAKARVQQQIR